MHRKQHQELERKIPQWIKVIISHLIKILNVRITLALGYLWQLAPNTHDGSSLGNEQFLKPPKIEMVGVVKKNFVWD